MSRCGDGTSWYLGPLEHSLGVQGLGLAGVVLVGLDPADVLTSSEAPLPQTLRGDSTPSDIRNTTDT